MILTHKYKIKILHTHTHTHIEREMRDKGAEGGSRKNKDGTNINGYFKRNTLYLSLLMQGNFHYGQIPLQNKVSIT